MNCWMRSNYFQHESPTSTDSMKEFASEKNITDINEQIELKDTVNPHFKPSLESTKYIVAGEDNAKSYMSGVLDVQNDQRDTENCLKKFQQVYNDLIEQRNKMKSNQHSSKRSNCKNIDSSNSTLSSSDDSKLNQLNTCIQSIEQLKPDNLINYNVCAENNNFNKNSTEEKSFNGFPKKDPENCFPCKNNNNDDDDQDKRKQKECEKEMYRFHKKINNTATKKKRTNNYFQKPQQQDCDTNYFAMLGEITKDISTIKKLFTKDKNPNLYYNKEKTNKTNQCDDAYVDDGVCKLNQHKTHTLQDANNPLCLHQNQRKNIINENEISAIGNGQNNVECCCTNEQLAYTEHQTTDGYYELQPPDHNTEKSNRRIVHFFMCENSQVCQCGIINNKSNCTTKNIHLHQPN